MGGGFRSVRPASALERHYGESRDGAHPSSRSVSDLRGSMMDWGISSMFIPPTYMWYPARENARQFAIMSIRVRGLVPTFPDGTQVAVERRVPKVSRAVGSAARKRGGQGRVKSKFGTADQQTSHRDKAILSLSGNVLLVLCPSLPSSPSLLLHHMRPRVLCMRFAF